MEPFFVSGKGAESASLALRLVRTRVFLDVPVAFLNPLLGAFLGLLS
jgi:hypothetical protein